MSYTRKQAAQEAQRVESGANKVVSPKFTDQRASTSVQLKQQQMMNAVQRAGIEEEPVQGKFATVQRAEEEELLQGKFATAQLAEEEELLQGKFAIAQLMEEEEPLQGKFANTTTTQLEEKPNNTGLPNQLKSGIESLSGMSMDGVKVHYNSDKPAQLNAHAYAQGTDIHVAPGQEQHLPHEAWHIVQQAQGRVQPTTQMKGTSVNDDVGLETEADVMGSKAVEQGSRSVQGGPLSLKTSLPITNLKQLMSVRTVAKVPSVELAKHLVPLVNQQAWATSKAKPRTTFISDSAEVIAAVNASAHNFVEATPTLGYKEIKPTITTTQYDKTGAGNGEGKPVTCTLAAAARECAVGVTKKAGVDDIVINHLANV